MQDWTNIYVPSVLVWDCAAAVCVRMNVYELEILVYLLAATCVHLQMPCSCIIGQWANEPRSKHRIEYAMCVHIK